MIHSVLRGAQNIGIIIRFGQDQRDVGPRGHGVRKQNIQGDLLRPTGVKGVGLVKGCKAIRRHLGECAQLGIFLATQPVQAWQPVECIEGI